MCGLIVYLDILKRFRTMREGDVTFSDLIMFNPFNKKELTEENRMDRQDIIISTSSGDRETTGYIFALVDDVDGMNKTRIVSKVVSLNEQLLGASNKDHKYYDMVRDISPEIFKGGSGDGDGDGNEIPHKKAAVNTRSKGGGGMKKSEGHQNRRVQNNAPGLKSSKGATGGNDGDESDSENEFRQGRQRQTHTQAGKRKRKRTKSQKLTSESSDSDSSDSDDADSDDADSDAILTQPKHLAKKWRKDKEERSQSGSPEEEGGRKSSGKDTHQKKMSKEKQVMESIHDHISGSETSPGAWQVRASATAPIIQDLTGGGGGMKPRLEPVSKVVAAQSSSGSATTTAPENQDHSSGGSHPIQHVPTDQVHDRSPVPDAHGSGMLGIDFLQGDGGIQTRQISWWDDKAPPKEGEEEESGGSGINDKNEDGLEAAEEEDFLTETESKKKSYRKELARLPKEFLEKRKTIRDEHPTLTGIFNYLDLILRENNRRLNILSGKVDALQIATADIEVALKRVDMKLEKSDVKTPAGARSIRRISGIPWKTVADVRNALCALKNHIVEMIIDRYPKKKAYWITPILADLFQPFFAKRVRFSASKNERRTKNYVRMGVHCPVLPLSFTELVRELIDKNTILENPDQEFKCVKNYFNNRNRAMRKMEIKKQIDTALDQQQGLRSKIACLLIANDLCESVGCITQPSPDTGSERDMAAWLDSFWKPALTKIANKRLKVSPEAVINETHLNIINMCLKVKSLKNKTKRVITIEDLKSYSEEKEIDKEDCYNDSSEDDDDGGDEGMTQ